MKNEMKIYTKTGDEGRTSLVGGKRVAKDHPRVMAYGDIDELISWIPILRVSVPEHDNELRRIQCALMNGSAHIASEDSAKSLPAFPAEDTAWLEKRIDEMTSALPQQTAFILPGGPKEAAECHVVRTVCRRCERSSIALGDMREEVKAVIKYINRLSDYMFTLARYVTTAKGQSEDFWLP